MPKRLVGIIGCRDKTSSWHVNGSPYIVGSNIGSTAYVGEEQHDILKKNQNAPRPSEHPPVRGKK